jgi:hypothetical protein
MMATKRTMLNLSQAGNTDQLRVQRMNSVASDNSTVDGPIDNISPLLMTMKIVNDGVHRTFYNYTAGAFDQFYQEANNAFLKETDIGFRGSCGGIYCRLHRTPGLVTHLIAQAKKQDLPIVLQIVDNTFTTQPERFAPALIYRAGLAVPKILCRPHGGTQMRRRVSFRARSFTSFFVLAMLVLVGLSIMVQSGRGQSTNQDSTANNAVQLVVQGRQIFRFDTFGDQAFWGDTLKLHQAIEGSGLGGIGPGGSPKAALTVGLKVDVDALPRNLFDQLHHASVNLNDPAVTVALLKLNAVVGVTGVFDSTGTLKSIGIQCALCHSTVDNPQPALCAGVIQPNPGTGCVGHRLDGWPNRDLNVDGIIALAPDLDAVASC